MDTNDLALIATAVASAVRKRGEIGEEAEWVCGHNRDSQKGKL